MKTRFGSFRGWHIWLSIALSLPILIVGLTAVFIAHDKALNLKSLHVPAAWSPMSQPAQLQRTDTEVRSLWGDAGGTQWLGSKMGLYRVGADGVPTQILGPYDVRALQGAGTSVLVAAKNGLWRVEPDGITAQRVHEGEYWSVAATPLGLLAVPKEADAQISLDEGRSWQAWQPAIQATEQLATTMAMQAETGQRTITLSKLVMDLHTGKAFFGKRYEWIWIDLVGLAMVLLTVTGLVMWWRSQRRKVTQLQASQRPAELPQAG
ncbi:MAG: PepSY domain-containing protein [Caldimonas sp.]|uniref:PepSY domain-containing protein n=1 Tax=Caldimonas sp. TaxID=2838790 RepID=UPI00391D2452